MFARILKKMAGDYNAKQLKKIAPIVDQINRISAEYDKLSDTEIQRKTQEFKQRLDAWETLDQILPEAFAAVKQACKRLVGHEYQVKWSTEKWFMIPFDVQLLGGIILHKGIISEMKTGEWKTIVATLPVYLNALTEKGVLLVTVNDWLASYQAELMRPVYERLGLSVGVVYKGVSMSQRRNEYSKDVTYVENSELWFDYLRDNLVKSMEMRALTRRPLHYAIVDEIDSILIDEARTPLIISEASEEPTDKYNYYAQIITHLTPCKNKKHISKWLLHELLNDDKTKKNEEEDGDYYIDEKTKTASLSSVGIAKLEQLLWVENLYKDIWFEEIHHIENALRAQAVFNKDKDYIVSSGEILIVDEHTGRTMPGRRFSEGMHQAIEAKESVQIKKESKTIATITYQNFFKQFQKLAGMTGTALTEWEEFNNIYKLEVLEVPTNNSIIRVDKLDKVFFNQKAKRNAVNDYIQFYHEIGLPMLIGTSNIATSEYVSKLLQEKSINHYVLNAKHHEQEAHIVANAGKYKSVVVATNMAGRGTDIKLEKDLHKKLAQNYAKRIAKQIEKNIWVSTIIYSSKEFERYIDGIKTQFNLSNEQIRSAEKDFSPIEWGQRKIIFNTKKKSKDQAFAEVRFKTTSNEIIEKEIHFWLFILGTEKHESRRIDNQLRGRAGRQGDAGVSVFFVALDDLIMRKMWWERIQSMASMLLKKEELEKMELTQKQFSNAILRAQKQMEWRHFSTRKHLFDYDSVVNTQRERIYKQRDEILTIAQTKNENNDPQALTTQQENFVTEKINQIHENISILIHQHIQNAKNLKQTTHQFLEHASKELNIETSEEIVQLANKNREEIQNTLTQKITNNFEENIAKIPNRKIIFTIIKDVYLYHIDKLRIEHIDEMQDLREKVSLMGYAQLDPLIMYKKEAYQKFEHLLHRIKTNTTLNIISINIQSIIAPQAQFVVNAEKPQEDNYMQNLQKIAQNNPNPKKINNKTQVTDPRKLIFQDEDGVEVFEANDETITTNASKVINTNTTKKLRPNDPCTCGSGKKYKKCCGT